MTKSTAPSSPPTSSWLEIADASDFSLQNIPFGVGSLKNSGSSDSRRFCCTAIGNHVINLRILQEAGLFDDIIGLRGNTFIIHETLNDFVVLQLVIMLSTLKYYKKLVYLMTSLDYVVIHLLYMKH